MKSREDKKGLTLLELLIVSGFLIIALTGLLATYIICLELAEWTRSANLALHTAQSELEKIRNLAFSNIGDQDGASFDVPGMAANDSLGYVTVVPDGPIMFNITIGVCWRQKGERIIGECQDSGGALIFSDSNANGLLDSPVQLSTQMAQR